MCLQILEFYSLCGCLYSAHAIRKCASYGRDGHPVQEQPKYVGSTCKEHRAAYLASLAARDSKETGLDNNAKTPFARKEGSTSSTSIPNDHLKWVRAYNLFSRQLWSEPELLHLFFEIVGKSPPQQDFQSILPRFLRIFAEDLGRAAVTQPEVQVSTSIYLFRHRIALNVEASYNEIISKGLTEREFGQTFREISLLLGGGCGEAEGEEEGRAIWDGAMQQFLFRGPPCESLKNRLKLYDMALGEEARYSEKLTDFVANAYQYFCPKDHGRHKQAKTTRLWWTCSCGRRLHDDYEGLRPEAVTDLRVFLALHAAPPPTTTQATQSNGPFPSQSSPRGIRGFESFPSMLWRFLSSIGNERLPRHQQDLGRLDNTDCTGASRSDTPQHKFLLLCTPFSKWGIKLRQPDVCIINSDQAFFTLLNASYQKHRAAYPWRWFKCLSKVAFVKLEVFPNSLVNICESPSMPPSQERHNYNYEESHTNPPVGPNMLMHLIENPDHAPLASVLFRRIPVTRWARLEVCPQKGFSCGWGVQFIESTSAFGVFLVGVLGFLLALVASVLWAVVRSDVQGGFGIGAFVLAFFLFCTTQLDLVI